MMPPNHRSAALFRWFYDWVLQSLALPFYLIIHPSGWRSQLQQIDSDLPVDFSSLCPKKISRRLLLQSFLVLPLVLVFTIGLWRVLAGDSLPAIVGQLLQSFAYAALGGFALSILVNMAAGIVFATSMAAVMALIPNDGNYFLYPMAVTAGLVAATLMNLNRSLSIRRRFRSLEGIALGMLFLTAVMGFVLLIISGQIVQNSPPIMIGVELHWQHAVLLSIQVFLAATFLYWLTLRLRYPVEKKGHLYALIPGVLLSLTYLGIIYSPVEKTVAWFLAGIVGGLFFSVLFGLPWNISNRLGGPVAGLLVGMLGMGLGWLPLASNMVVGFVPGTDKLVKTMAVLALSFSHPWWRPLMVYPVTSMTNWILYQIDRRRLLRGRSSLLRGNSAFWDEAQFITAAWLEEHLLLVAEYDPDKVNLALRDLSQTNQRWVAREVQLELIARQLEAAVDIQKIASVHQRLASGALSGSANAMLRSFSQVSHDVQAGLLLSSPYHVRLSLTLVMQRLENMERDLRLQPEIFAVRFMPIAAEWRRCVNAYHDHLAGIAQQVDLLVNPYVIGAPLDEQQEIFVGRDEILDRILKHLVIRTSAPLVIQGQRRMGKTSLLLNLRKLLPPTAVMVYVDCQTIVGMRTYAEILHGLVVQARKYLMRFYRMSIPEFSKKDSTSVYEWLDEISRLHRQNPREWVLVLDEFESFRLALARVKLDPAYLLNILRHVTQHYTLLKIIISGNLIFNEDPVLAGYLVGAKIMKLGILYPRDAQKLIEQPVSNFRLKYEPEAVERIMSLTRGHPHLLQQLCFELVELKNIQTADRRFLVTRADVDEVIPQVLMAANFFFYDLENNQMLPDGRKFMCQLAARGEMAVYSRLDVKGMEQTIDGLVQRDLLEPVQGGYRFKYELVRLWFDLQSRQITRPLKSPPVWNL